MFENIFAILYVPLPWVVPALLMVETFKVPSIARVAVFVLFRVSVPTTVPDVIEKYAPLL